MKYIFFTFLFIFSIILISSVIQVQTDDQSNVQIVRDTSNLPSGMEHYWKLDETSGAPYIDRYSGAGGNCTGGCPTAVTGMIDGAQEFTDTAIGGIDVTDVSTFNWTANESFTIELWMQSGEKGATSPDGTERNGVLMGRVDTDGNLLWYIGTDYFGSTGKAVFGVNHNTISSTSNIADGAWHHVVCVRDADNNKIKLYVDGVFQSDLSDVNVGVDLDGESSAVNIGHLNWRLTAGDPDTTFEYNGLLDEITVFDTALNDANISQHYQNGLAGRGFENPAQTLDTATSTVAASPAIIAADK